MMVCCMGGTDRRRVDALVDRVENDNLAGYITADPRSVLSAQRLGLHPALDQAGEITGAALHDLLMVAEERWTIPQAPHTRLAPNRRGRRPVALRWLNLGAAVSALGAHDYVERMLPARGYVPIWRTPR